MADIGHNLMIKYGLPRAPSQDLIDRWIRTTEALIQQGHEREIAGSAAAKQIFPGFQTHMYASEADTIESLLGRARDK